MILEDIGVEPVLFSEANQIQMFELPGGCQLLVPVKSELDSQRVKKKLQKFYDSPEWVL